MEACKSIGVDWSFDEHTPDEVIAEKQRQWDSVPTETKAQVWEKLLELNAASVQDFKGALEAAILRQIVRVFVVPLHGKGSEFSNVSDAVQFLVEYDELRAVDTFVKYEVQIRYNNRDKIDAEFQEKGTAVDFLKAYLSGNWTPVDLELAGSVESEGEETDEAD